MIAYNVPEIPQYSYMADVSTVSSAGDDSDNSSAEINKNAYGENGGSVTEEEKPKQEDIEVMFPDDKKADEDLKEKLSDKISITMDFMDGMINKSNTATTLSTASSVARNIVLTLIVAAILTVFYFTMKKDDN